MAMLDLQGMEYSDEGDAHHSSNSIHSCDGGFSTLSLLIC